MSAVREFAMLTPSGRGTKPGISSSPAQAAFWPVRRRQQQINDRQNREQGERGKERGSRRHFKAECREEKHNCRR